MTVSIERGLVFIRYRNRASGAIPYPTFIALEVERNTAVNLPLEMVDVVLRAVDFVLGEDLRRTWDGGGDNSDR